MKTSRVNPAIVSAFRVFAIVMLTLGLFPFVFQFFGLPSNLLRFMGNPYITLIAAAGLVAYLSWTGLQGRLGRFYLPIAFGIATLAPIIANFLAFDFTQAGDLAQVRSLAGQWQVIFLLFVPLILISWQYSFRVVFFYCLSLVGIDLIFIFIPTLAMTAGQSFYSPWLQAGPIFLRTAIYLLVGYMVSRLVASQREQTARLEQAYHQLANYATTNEQLTLSRERNRLARELHDTLAHTLSASAVQLEAISSLWESDLPKAHEILVQSLKLTREGLNETRRAIQSLRAAPVEELGLVMGLSNLARTIAQRAHLSLELTVPEHNEGWPSEIEHVFYRIAEEALHNIAQHARAQTLAVALKEKSGRLSLSIHDDGRGFSPDQIDPEQRFGLLGMRERAEAISASLSITSEPGLGTTVLLAYPPAPQPAGKKHQFRFTPPPGPVKLFGNKIG
jgi:signal transduction histidine kinase